MIGDFQLQSEKFYFFTWMRETLEPMGDIGPHGGVRTPPNWFRWFPIIVRTSEKTININWHYTFYCVRWDTYFQANRVEHQKLNQTTADLSFG